jgi:hypothetical protein
MSSFNDPTKAIATTKSQENIDNPEATPSYVRLRQIWSMIANSTDQSYIDRRMYDFITVTTTLCARANKTDMITTETWFKITGSYQTYHNVLQELRQSGTTPPQTTVVVAREEGQSSRIDTTKLIDNVAWHRKQQELHQSLTTWLHETIIWLTHNGNTLLSMEKTSQ